ncbi:stage III sporulation protein AH [Virgibacillus pantothenticus]|uniref:Stage III sporulation protein AH n=1 Tax=Virgibacillus pantothenticus TaxID=1473 RepID=A0A0L0QPF7_VIRPA|nr:MULTISPECIES: SpoIIIAH-like family protein [Virgibacillus]API90507.1 stage III sporulation protein AH [Virgibacillus sp. 6R]KNE20467.1 stage III sporulation protein AH [Virgibacillus pantothenticus]MBS7429616.1 SpoIIIAH-like family protein [Virgibacillus sp. 19R1-5]MBU8565491.1 SpoIIIAH-like family protein [Virgibacillus pantothenticus]MBU8599791.1 SpoIIIAH-like family protein [Virgibacillus pantothenticus]
MLKKQTVWLLTMLSLMIVLSVYYMTSPDSEDLAYINDGQDNTNEKAVPTDSEANDDAEVEEISNVGQDELFTTIRMELQDKRNMEKERLTDVVASSSASAAEKDEALQEIDAIEDLASKEKILEETIVASANYEDVLVRSDDESVTVQVKVEENLPKSEAVSIIQMVKDELGDKKVNVSYLPSEAPTKKDK